MTDVAVLLSMAVVAAVVTGALGYGFSSLTVPIALLFFSARLLNPALVIVELALNLYALFLNRSAARGAAPRLWPIIGGLIPGVIVGSWLVSRIDAQPLKLVTFAALLPLILLQAGGWRWPIRRERLAGPPLGIGVGLLYSLTTISGPPLALFFNNQALEKRDFKVSLAIVRSAESAMTLVAYAALGLFTRQSFHLVGWLVPAVVVGMPFGHWLIRHLEVESFRRLCMSFDAWLVAFALHRLLPGVFAWIVPLLAVGIDVVLLIVFFSHGRRRHASTMPARIPI